MKAVMKEKGIRMRTVMHSSLARIVQRRHDAMSALELLVVMVIIGVIAAIGVGLAGLASRMSKEQRVRSELSQLSAAIESYKAHYGFYPPDNPLNPVTNQLYYELTGTLFTGNAFRPSSGEDEISQGELDHIFHVRTIANSSRDAKELKRFVQLNAKQHQVVYTNPTVEILVTPVDWPTNRPQFPAPMPQVVGWVNPWRYVSTKPTNNPRSFDLWAEIVIGKERKVIGNWK
jgi:prepilin-type N-terminal cleavage/methylation domain-containing protein